MVKTKAHRILALILTAAMLFALIPNVFSVQTAAASAAISNDSLSAVIGDLGQIETLNIINNPVNNQGNEINFVLPNSTSPQNGVQHQWMGELIFSYRTNDTGVFPDNRDGFVEVDTNKTLAAGGSTTYSDATENLESNPYIRKTQVSDDRVEIDFIGHNEDSDVERAMKGFDVQSAFDMDTDDGSLLWEITLTNKGTKYIEFGDVGLPMPWNNKYTSLSSTYNQRVTAHTFAGADSGYAYAIRPSGEGNYMLFTPVAESGARIEYIDNWMHNNNGVTGERAGSLYTNWTGDSGGWQPGLSVYYIHSKDIHKTGRSYFEDYTSLVLAPGESKTYQFKFSAVRAGDNSPQESASDPNNASDSMEEREANLRSILYQSGMIDAVAVPSFQTAINMPTKLDLHYDDSLISDVKVQIQCVHENDPFDLAHIPTQATGLVNNARAERGLHDGNPGYDTSCTYAETRIVDGEQHHIYDLTFGCIGNNSVRVDYKLKVGDEYVDKFTQFEFNVLTEIDEAVDAHASFMVENQQDTDPESATYGIYDDWYFASGRDTNAQSHWGDDWSHDNINFITMKNYLNPDPEEVKSIELYLIDFMWETFMKNTQSTYTVANYLSASGAYSSTSSPYTRTFSEMMAATGYFNMYRIQKAYPDLIEYRETPLYYLEKAYGIYANRVGTGTTGFYGEQQVPDIIEALRAEGLTDEANNLQTRFAYTKGRNMANTTYPYGSEFVYDNTGEEGIYAASKALRTYYPSDSAADSALAQMQQTDGATRAKRGIQPTWYHYADPVFIGGEHWWNFQYTASLAGSITDDWLRYQDNGWDIDSRAWAERVNYAAKLSNFNAINMGQIDDSYIGNVSWRYTSYKGGHGAMNVNDRGTRVMNNGWNDFSGEADEGLYGSLLSISSDVVTDPIFGLFGYGCEVEKSGEVYNVVPLDGVGKRLNLLDEKLYLTLETDRYTEASIEADGSLFSLTLENLTETAHISRIDLSGAGLENGYYSIKLDGVTVGQCFVSGNEGTAYVQLTADDTAEVTIEKMDNSENQAPTASISISDQNLQAIVPFTLTGSAIDDGAPDGTLTYSWEVLQTPEGGEMTFVNPDRPITEAKGTKEGNYEVQLTVSDGVLTGTSQAIITLGEAPERQVPTIGTVTAKQGAVNQSVVTLSGEAVGDPLYNGELAYEWSLIAKPDGADVIIAGADQSNTKMKVTKAGTYTIRFTATDADVSAYEEITIEVTGDVDGIDQAVSVVTQAGTAPVLPETTEVIYTDGTIADANVVWDAVDPAQYEAAGQFKVEGTVESSELKAAVTVYVVDKEKYNYALAAKPSAIINTPQDLGGVTKLNDGIDPARSNETANGVWHNWLGDQSGPAWVQYEWDQALLATSMDVYVFRDGSGNFRPKDMQVSLRDENGNWYTPRAVEGLGNTLNQYNTTTFEPAYITGIRIDMKPVTVGCGIIEWKVYGYSDQVIVDKSELRSVYDITGAYRAAQFEGGLTPIEEAKAAASAVLDDSSVTQEEVDEALTNLIVAMGELQPLNGNLAYAGGLSASFTSSWESLPAVNNGSQLSSGHWGTWGNSGSSEWIQYTWPMGAKIQVSDLYIWNDGGGIKTPTSYTYSYLPMDSDEWVTLATIDSGIVANASNLTLFEEPVMARALRCTITKVENNSSNGVGLWEWEVYADTGTEDVYTVTFESNGGSEVSNQTVFDGDTVTKPANPTKDGHTFDGWYSDEDMTTAYDFDAAVTSDFTLYAKWTINSYTVEFNSNGGSSVDSQTIVHGGTVIKPADPARTGYTFDGWYSDEALTVEYDFSTPVTSVVNLYAKWIEIPAAYTVTFESNGGSNVDSQTVTDGDKVTKPSDPTKVGHTFDGWYSDENLTTAYDFNAEVTSDLTLYAKWIIKTYTVTFNSNGGSSVDSQTIVHGGTVIKPADPTRTGYSFDGWYSDEALSTAYDFDAAVTADITLYAKWIEIPAAYTVTFESNGGSNVDNQTVTDGGKVEKPADPTRTGYTFGGWYTDNGTFANAWNFETGAVIADMTLYAKWTEVVPVTYTVTFDTNGGAPASGSQTVEHGGKVAKPADPAREGYTFIGWYNGENLWSFETDTVTQNMTLYAKWVPDTITAYTVTFNSGGGSPTPDSQTVPSGEKAAKPADPVKEGYTFSGWFTDNEAFNNEWNFETGTVTADMTLYAKWERVHETHKAYVGGYSEDGTMRPEGKLTRAEAVTIIVRTLVEDYDESVNYPHGFTDVNDKPWYAHYIGWAVHSGLVTGDGNGKFRPEETITREELMAIVARTGEVLTAGEMDFKDTADISRWALDVVYTCVKNGWVKGDDNGKLRPKDSITRAEMVTIINRMLGRDKTTAESVADVLKDLTVFPDANDTSKWWYYQILEASNTHSYYVDDSDAEIWVSVG